CAGTWALRDSNRTRWLIISLSTITPSQSLISSSVRGMHSPKEGLIGAPASKASGRLSGRDHGVRRMIAIEPGFYFSERKTGIKPAAWPAVRERPAHPGP